MNDIGRNLKRIRLLNNLSLKEAGELLKMTAPAVQKYENGDIIPNSEKLIEFANAYNVMVLDLLKIYQVPEMKFNTFRKKQRLKGQNLDLLKEIIQNNVANYLEVIELNQIKSSTKQIKKYHCNSYDEIELIAEKFKKDFDLSINQPISDLISVLENNGILIIQIDNQDDKFKDFDGLSEVINNIPIIVLLKYNNDGARQRFTIAHELGHLLLDIKKKELDEEKACNRFAGALLMPKEAVINEFGPSRNIISFFELKAFKTEYKVSMQAIIYRLKELDIISDYTNRRINILFNKYGFRKKEPVEIKPEESMQYIKLVHKLEVNQIISLNKACELLGVSQNDYYNQDNSYGY